MPSLVYHLSIQKDLSMCVSTQLYAVPVNPVILSTVVNPRSTTYVRVMRLCGQFNPPAVCFRHKLNFGNKDQFPFLKDLFFYTFSTKQKSLKIIFYEFIFQMIRSLLRKQTKKVNLGHNFYYNDLIILNFFCQEKSIHFLLEFTFFR